MMSSRMAFVEGERYNEGFVADGCLTGAQVLREKGYETVALVKNPWLFIQTKTGKRDIVVSRGFERYLTGYMSLVPNPLFEQGIGEKEVFDRFASAKQATEQAYGALKQLRNPRGPFFLYVHYMDTHEPYNPPDEYKSICAAAPVEGIPDHVLYQAIRTEARKRGEEVLSEGDAAACERARDLYDAAVNYVDEWVGRLVDCLRSTGLLDSTLVVLASDHGEEFAEHGWIGHSKTLYDESLSVPLIAAGRGVEDGLRVDSPVCLTDVAPTMLSSCGLVVPESMSGAPLALTGESPPAPSPAIAALVRPDGPAPLFEKKYAVADPRGMKYIRSEFLGEKGDLEPVEELYDLASDAGETENIVGGEPQAVAALREYLHSARTAAAPRVGEAFEVDDETRELLESLGYLQ